MPSQPHLPTNLVSNVLVPVANETDARKTAKALRYYNPRGVTALYVVEKGEGVPDKTPVEQSEEIAEDAVAAFRKVFPDAKELIVYRRDIVEAIFDAADEVNASAIAYRAREGNRLMQLLSGDLSLKLVTQARRPVIALPQPPGDA